MIFDHTTIDYQQRLLGQFKHNGAYYYSKEIVKNMIPRIKTNRDWVTINDYKHCTNGAIVFIHNNKNPQNYNWLRKYKDLILVCGVPSTCQKVQGIGKAIYLPLSVDTLALEPFKTEKTIDCAFVGRSAKLGGFKLPKGCVKIQNLARTELLRELAKCRKVYAVGRCAIEARFFGCEVLPYDPRYPDPSVWQVLDNREAAKILQEKLDKIDGVR